VSDPHGRLEAAIRPGQSVLVDTSVVLSYLGGGEATSDLARQLFDAFAATGRNPTTLSAVTVGEILVRPFRRGTAAIATAEGFLRHFGDLHLIHVTYEVAREGARIRALTDLAMPDALIVGSASATGTDIVVTNDRSWPTRLAPVLPGLLVVVLTDLA
jgi:predicted nucleic acid-binding protein